MYVIINYSNMDTSKEDNPIIFSKEFDLCDLERKCRAFVEKQHLTENQFKNAHQQTQEMILAKLELERILDRERRELSDTNAQLQLMQNTMQKWEQERSNVRDATLKQSLQIESLTKERDLLNNKVKQLEVQNVELRLKLEETEKQLATQKLFENTINSKKTAIDAVFGNIFTQNQKLEKDQHMLRKTVIIAKKLGEQMMMLLKHHHEALNNSYTENEKLLQTQFILKSELDQINSSVKMKRDDNTNTESVSLFQNQIKEYESLITILNQRIETEVEEKKKLNETLENTLKEQAKFNEFEQVLQHRVIDLENQLHAHEHIITKKKEEK